MNDFQKEVAELFHHFVQIERKEFFGNNDLVKWLPEFQIDDAKCMCPPFMGKNYKRGGLIILPINPGGGNEKNDVRNYGDSILYPVCHNFKSLENNIAEYYWESFVPTFINAKMSYPIYSKITDILQCSQTTLDDICYFNFLPYRGKSNKYPATKKEILDIVPKCREIFVEPLLDFLRPSLVVAFGKQVDTYIIECWRNFPFEKVSWNRARVETELVLKEREFSKKVLRDWASSQMLKQNKSVTAE